MVEHKENGWQARLPNQETTSELLYKAGSLPTTQKPLTKVVAALNLRSITLGWSPGAPASHGPSRNVLKTSTLLHNTLRGFASTPCLRRRIETANSIPKFKKLIPQRKAEGKRKNKPLLVSVAQPPEPLADQKASKIYEGKPF